MRAVANPKSTHQSTLRIMGVELIVHNLDNGQRVIEQDGLRQLFQAMANGIDMQPGEAEALAKAVRP